MAFHARHVLSTPGTIRAQIKFQRRDLLYRHREELHDPYAAAKRRKARQEGLDVERLILTVPGLPMETEDGYLVGPTLLDMLVRRRWSFDDLPDATQRALVRAHNRRQREVPKSVRKKLPGFVFAWSARDLATLWPRPGQSRFVPREGDEPLGATRRIDHPFLVRLTSGGLPGYSGVGDWIAVHKLSTCQINEHIYRVALGVIGGLDAAYRHIANLATAAWNADLERALQLWELVQGAPGGVLIEDESVEKLRPICSISQEVERAVMGEVCQWLGIDPELSIKRDRGRPKGSQGDEGKVLRVELQPDGSTRGRFIDDFENVAAGTEFHELSLQALVSTLGALRQQRLETDAELLEAWLDAALPDWRESVAADGEDVGDTSAARHPDPYEVLGVEHDAPMPLVVAAYRRAVKAVHPDVSGASAWLIRAVNDAYRQIRAEREGKPIADA